MYNDLDGEVVNVFAQARGHGLELEALLRLTPFARAEFDLSYEPCADPLERARRTVVRSFMGYSSAATTRTHRTGFRATSNRSGTPPAADWRNLPGHLAEITERLQGVVIEHRPALEVLRGQDTPTTLHYVDPPYVHATRCFRGRNGAYAHELTDDEHRELAGVLRSLEGMVIVSGYASDLYDVELFRDWHRERCDTIKSTNAGNDGASEVIWYNDTVRDRLAAEGRQRVLFPHERPERAGWRTHRAEGRG